MTFKRFEPIDLRENKKKIVLHTSKLHGYANINVIGGIPNGMYQSGLDLIPKPKPTKEGRGPKRELRTFLHHLKVKFKRLSNGTFGNEPSLDK
jgi:hypothetical protein